MKYGYRIFATQYGQWERLEEIQGIKNPLYFRGMADCTFPSSCGLYHAVPPELAPFLSRNGTDGLPGFVGPFPSTSLDESDLIAGIQLLCLRSLCLRTSFLCVISILRQTKVGCQFRESCHSQRATTRDRPYYRRCHATPDLYSRGDPLWSPV